MYTSHETQLIEKLPACFDLYDEQFQDWNHKYFKKHRVRYSYMLDLVRQIYDDGEILEIGSLPCHLISLLKQMDYPIVGLDIDPERGKRFIEHFGLHIERCDIEREVFPFDGDRFSLVLFCDVFEHLRINPVNTLREIHRVLRPGGQMILTTNNMNYISNRLSLLFGRKYDNPYRAFEKLEELGHMGHIRQYNLQQVEVFLKNCGFAVSHVDYQMFRKMKKAPQAFLGDVCKVVYPSFRKYMIIVADSK